MKKSAIVLAGGFSERFGKDKYLVELAGEPLVVHVLERISGIVDERVVVVASKAQRNMLSNMFEGGVSLVVDRYEGQSPLVGALTGFECVRGEYSLLLPCDTPFISTTIVELLFDMCAGRSAVVPKWPNGFIEPLQAVYNTKHAVNAAEAALEEGRRNMASMIERLRGVRYVSTLVLQECDSELLTFFNVNTPLDLKRAEAILGRGR